MSRVSCARAILAHTLVALNPGQDLRQRFQEEGTVQQPIGEATLGQMMRVYSPGYEDAKDAPDLVANATKWLRRLWEVNGAK